MDGVIGSIGPLVEIGETPGFAGPTRTILLSDTDGVLHGQLLWLRSEMDEDFLAELAVLCSIAMRARVKRSPSAG